MLNFFKRFFKEKEPEITTLNLEDLKSFFDEKSKELTQELNQKIDEIKGNINSEINKTKGNLTILKRAELRNPNIPIRARQFMDGNRASYMRLVNNLLDCITVGNDYALITKFCEDFDNRLVQFTKSTTKAYQVLQEFFAHESREIALNIKRLDSLIKELKETINEKNLDKLKKLKEDIISIDKKKEQRINLEKELKEKEAQKEEKMRLKKDLEELKDELKGSNEYNELLSLNELKKKSLNEFENLKNKIFHSFSVVNAALRKYYRITVKDTELLNRYLKDPVQALLRDDELNILELLDGTRKNILNNSIELKDKRKDKTLEEINGLGKEFFINFKNEYEKIKEKIRELEEKIKQNDSKAKLEELNKKTDEASQNLHRLDSYSEYLKKEIEEIDFEKIKRGLEREIEDVFKVEVSIS